MIQISDIKQLLEEYEDNKPAREKKAKKLEKELKKIRSKNNKAQAERQRIRGLLRGNTLTPFQRRQYEFLVEKDEQGNYPNFQANAKTLKLPTSDLVKEIRDLRRKNPFIYIDLGIDKGRYRLDLNRAKGLDDLAERILKRRKQIIEKDLDKAIKEGKEKQIDSLTKLLNQANYNLALERGEDTTDFEEEFDISETDIKPIGVELFNQTIKILS